MAKLTKCPDCGSSVSMKAIACPSCGRPLKAKKKGCLSGCGTLVLLGVASIVAIIMLMPKGHQQDAAPPRRARDQTASTTAMLPAVTAFLREHQEFGSPGTVEQTADWAEGKRQIISFSSGKYFEFYEAKGQVTTVWETGRGQERKAGSLAAPSSEMC